MDVECSVSLADCYVTLALSEVGKDETEKAYASYLIDAFYENMLHMDKPHRKAEDK